MELQTYRIWNQSIQRSMNKILVNYKHHAKGGAGENEGMRWGESEEWGEIGNMIVARQRGEQVERRQQGKDGDEKDNI